VQKRVIIICSVRTGSGVLSISTAVVRGVVAEQAAGELIEQTGMLLCCLLYARPAGRTVQRVAVQRAHVSLHRRQFLLLDVRQQRLFELCVVVAVLVRTLQ